MAFCMLFPESHDGTLYFMGQTLVLGYQTVLVWISTSRKSEFLINIQLYLFPNS